MTSSPAVGVTRIARRRAKPGREAEYEALIREMFSHMRLHSGFLGADLVPPEKPGQEYQVIVNFSSEEVLGQWDGSELRAAIHERMLAVTEDAPDYRVLSGMEAWFVPAAMPSAPHPPRSRMAVVTWLGIYPTVALFLWVLSPWLAPLPYLLRIAILTAVIVVIMTWGVMPRLTRLLRPWLLRH